MRIKSNIIANASGSLGGITATPGSGGIVLRSRVNASRRQTAALQSARSFTALINWQWMNSLTEAQRDAWNAYAVGLKIHGRLGDTRRISGLNAFRQERQRSGFQDPSRELNPPDPISEIVPNRTTIDWRLDGGKWWVTGSSTDPWAYNPGNRYRIRITRPCAPNKKPDRSRFMPLVADTIEEISFTSFYLTLIETPTPTPGQKILIEIFWGVIGNAASGPWYYERTAP